MKSFVFSKDVLSGKLQSFDQYGKFVTRRTTGLDEINKEPDKWLLPINFIREKHAFEFYADINTVIYVKPRYQVGERVFIREPFTVIHYDQSIAYRTGLSINARSIAIFESSSGKWLSPYAMSEKEARHFGTVTSVSIERLQSITPEDCFLEGILPLEEYGTNTLINEFKSLWNSFAKPPLDWDSNPWVFRYEVLKHEVAK